MPQKRPYVSWFDATLDIPVQQQGDDPAGLQFIPIASTNKRTITGGDSNLYVVSDLGVNARGSKSIIWSSEGYTYNGVAVPALTANQKKVTGSHITNAGGTLGTVAAALDLSPYRAVSLFVVLTSFTGGASPSFQPELDFIDDAGTPNVIAAFKPTAATTATSWITNVGQGLSTATITGFTITNIGTPVLPNAQIQWTIANTPTAVVWTAFLYGIN